MSNPVDWEGVRPEGLAARILAVTIVFSILCIAVVGLRIWLRYRGNCIGTDDWLMTVGCALNLVHNGVVTYGCFTGIGTPDSKLNAAQMSEAAKIILLWQLFYVSGSLFIKSSICTTLIRVALHQRYIWILRVLILVSAIITIMAMTVVLVRCKPVAANYDPTLGTCVNQDLILAFTYVVSGVNIATDWSVAIIPIFILWDVQMRRYLKIMTWVVLGLGVLASVATIIRTPYSSAYSNPSNQLYNIGNIILWTVVECDLGIIAGSLPMLRMLMRELTTSSSNPPNNSSKQGSELVTIGRIKGRRNQVHNSDFEVSILAADDADGHGDNDSTRGMIKVTREVAQTHS
ncbi:hypothetical protein AB5N19_04486 [Seiridium cardinale]